MPVVIEEQPLPVREARAGEPEAWEALLARYRLPLYAYVFELVHHEQTTLDIVQESFVIPYSVGWNEKDDGGQVVQRKAEETASEVTEGDWVWQYPAPAEKAAKQ